MVVIRRTRKISIHTENEFVDEDRHRLRHRQAREDGGYRNIHTQGGASPHREKAVEKNTYMYTD